MGSDYQQDANQYLNIIGNVQEILEKNALQPKNQQESGYITDRRRNSRSLHDLGGQISEHTLTLGRAEEIANSA